MTPPNSMTIEELLELAALDAFGLLDEYEAALYTRSFHHAPAPVQDEIIRIQSDLVSDETLLGSDTPEAALRERVLKAVSRAIEEECHEFAPLASIGRREREGGGAAIRRLTLSGQFWRAAALVMVAASIVLAYFVVESNNWANHVAALALDNNTSAQLEDLIGPTFKEFIGNPNCEVKRFEPVAAQSKTLTALYVNELQASAFLLLIGLPVASEPYELWALTENGARELVATIDVRNRVTGLRLDSLTASLVAAMSWEIADAAGTVLLRST